MNDTKMYTKKVSRRKASSSSRKRPVTTWLSPSEIEAFKKLGHKGNAQDGIRVMAKAVQHKPKGKPSKRRAFVVGSVPALCIRQAAADADARGTARGQQRRERGDDQHDDEPGDDRIPVVGVVERGTKHGFAERPRDAAGSQERERHGYRHAQPPLQDAFH